MDALPDRFDLRGVPPYVESWCVARIPGFVPAVLQRWQRNYGQLPRRFCMVMCPQVEINALGGLPPEVSALTHPKLTCRHFTGCHKPYFVVLFVGADADRRRRDIQGLLPWSEGYAVSLTEDAIRLDFVEATEGLDDDGRQTVTPRTLQNLLQTGELISILA